MNCQGLFLIDGDAGTLLAHSLFTDVLKHLDRARKELSKILQVDPSNDYALSMDLRLHTLILVVRNADITARYQCYLDSFRPSGAPSPTTMVIILQKKASPSWRKTRKTPRN